MKILITDKTHPALQQVLEADGHRVTVDTTPDYQRLLDCIAQYDALVVRSKISIDRHFLDHARHLKCIGRVGAGMETIDVEYAEQLGIRCLNSPEGNQDAVGEHAAGLLLALFNHIAAADAEVRQGLWRREANRGLEVKGKTVGIIGFGHMGSAFARRLQGFGCRLMAYDLLGERAAGYEWTPGVECATLEQLQAEADVVSLHVPLTEQSRYMVDEDFLKAFKKNIYIINTSRGAVVKTAALAQALREGKVLGAALDVMEYEDMSRDGLRLDALPPDWQYIASAPNTVLTPHVAGWTAESKEKLARVLGEKINKNLQSDKCS